MYSIAFTYNVTVSFIILLNVNGVLTLIESVVLVKLVEDDVPVELLAVTTNVYEVFAVNEENVVDVLDVVIVLPLNSNVYDVAPVVA